MIHYHGGPITPDPCALRVWKGRHALVSFATPRQIDLCAEVCQSFCVDTGDFSAWTGSFVPDREAYFSFVRDWINHPGFDFAMIPDVIGGSEEENDELLRNWPFPLHKSAAVWHTNESPERLIRLARSYPRVAVGSSGEFDVSSPTAYLKRMREVLPPILDKHRRPIAKLHGLRVLNHRIFTRLPYSSGDSSNVARNIGIEKKWQGRYLPCTRETRAAVLTERIEFYNGAGWLPVDGDSDS